LSPSPAPNVSDHIRCHSVPFRADRPLDGIVSFLTRTFGDNIHDLRAVKVSASSHVSSSGVAVIVDFSSVLKGFATEDLANSWICIDFKTRRLPRSTNPSRYSIRTLTGSDAHQARSWVLEESNDCAKWITLDSREDTRELSVTSCVEMFSVGNPRFVRLLRIRQTRLCSYSTNRLVLKWPEFFGSVLAGPLPA
jgi:hypothetical protein